MKVFGNRKRLSSQNAIGDLKKAAWPTTEIELSQLSDFYLTHGEFEVNKVYKVVWNVTTATWTAVSEIAHGRGKSNTVENNAEQIKKVSAKGGLRKSLSVLTFSLMAAFGAQSAFAYIEINTITNNYAYNSGTANVVYDGGDAPINYNTPGNLSYTDPNALPVSSGNWSDYKAEGIAIGRYSTVETPAGTSSGIAIGDYSYAGSGLTVALGQFAQATGVGSMALGTATLASGDNSLALMRQSVANNDFAIAVGTAAVSSGLGSIAMGQSSTATGEESIAIGSSNLKSTKQDNGNGLDVSVMAYDPTNNVQAAGARASLLAMALK